MNNTATLSNPRELILQISEEKGTHFLSTFYTYHLKFILFSATNSTTVSLAEPECQSSWQKKSKSPQNKIR